ncbi:pentapeptide repeat-containing protein [Thaumasiovibrio subtropicus]|uniref:pentapeptide repeat-containing protein n=1 Tax=Thaumasiovibrio subtropicus TaxID=1891207 RepID=UPI000B35A982|nr:pentapeptide repeat-containing protein [Thaumasiovibrio subtropicus]
MLTIENNQSYYDEVFRQVALSDEKREEIEFEDCEFVDCDFSRTTFKRCRFLNCQFLRCNLSLIALPATRVSECDFADCKLVGVDWTQADWPTYIHDHELKFRRSILNDSAFFGLTLHALVLEECKLRDVDFREGDFTHASMTYCDFSGSQFMRTILASADLTESTDYCINVLENRLSGAKLSRFQALNLLESLGIELVD